MDLGTTFAVPHPLTVPELALMIMEELRGYKRALHSAILVHPTWAFHAMPFLWCSVDLDKAFVNIASARRQLYANYVCRLSVFASGNQVAVDPPLEFPRLQEIYIDALTGWQLTVRMPRTPDAPAGKSVDVQKTRGSSRLFTCLQQWLSPLVTTVTLANYDEQFYASVIKLLLESNHLARLCFHRGKHYRLREHLVAAVGAAPWQPRFQSLRVFSAHVKRSHVPAVATALQLAPLLTHVSLLIPSANPHGALAAVSALPATLQALQLEFDDDAELRRPELLALRTLTELRELTLQPLMHKTFYFLARAPEFTDAYLVHLLSGLPKLRRFLFGVRAGWRPTTDGSLLQRIGNAAPLLEELGLAGSVTVQGHDPLAPTAAFPCLQTLIICHLSPPLTLSDAERHEIEYLQDLHWHDEIAQVKTVMRHHMPRLRSLAISSIAPFSCRLVDWVARTRDTDDPLALDEEEDDVNDDENREDGVEEGSEPDSSS